jgi:hypothetical protein
MKKVEKLKSEIKSLKFLQDGFAFRSRMWMRLGGIIHYLEEDLWSEQWKEDKRTGRDKDPDYLPF